MRLWIYIVRRSLLVVPVIIGVMTITFVLISALPVSERLEATFGTNPRVPYTPTVPCSKLGIDTPGNCTNPIYKAGIDKLGLNQPVPVQWAVYMYNSLTLHWGYVGNASGLAGQIPLAKGQPVTTVLGWFLPYTLELAGLSLAIILLISIPLGNLSAVNRNRPIDQGSRVLSFSGYALPAFLLGSFVLMAAVLVIGGPSGKSPFCAHASSYFDLYGSWPAIQCWAGSTYPTWLKAGQVSSPTGFPTVDAAIHGQYWVALDTLVRMILPAFVIAYGTIAVLLRFVRNSMLEVLNLDFIRTARAKGVPERSVIKKHAGRNSLNVTLTVVGLTFAGFIAGFPIIEVVFGLNGVGRLLAYSVTLTPLDFGTIFGTTILFTIIVVAANLTVDVLYAVLDPRVRLG
jgi:ABC-type dipeptide/oligopeptide/nickel transport system permease component